MSPTWNTSAQDLLNGLVHTRMPGNESWIAWSRYGMDTQGYTPGTSLAASDGIRFNLRSWDPIRGAAPAVSDLYRLTAVSGFENVEVRDLREPRAGNHGDIAYDAYLGGRNVVLTGRIEAYNLAQLRYMQARLKEECLAEMNFIQRQGRITWGNQLGTLWIMDRDRKSVLLAPGRVIDLRMSESQKSDQFFRDFQITIRLPRPYFSSYASATGLLGDHMKQIGSTVNLIGGATGFTVGGNVTRDAVLVVGNYPTGASSSMTGDLTITNTTTGDVVVLTAPSWGSDVWWGIDSRDEFVSENNVKDIASSKTSFLKLTSMAGNFIRLAPGSNTITRSGTVATGTPKLAVFTWDNATV